MGPKTHQKHQNHRNERKNEPDVPPIGGRTQPHTDAPAITAVEQSLAKSKEKKLKNRNWNWECGEGREEGATH